MKNQFLFWSIVILFLFFGCGRSHFPKYLPRLYPCEITVIQDNKPLADAIVALQFTDLSRPKNGQLWFPMGTTNNDGQAVIHTNAQYDGSPLGTYKVLVSKTKQGPSKYGSPPPKETPQYDKWEELSSDEVRSWFGLVEEKFNQAEQTPYEIKIQKGKNKLTVDVGKAVEYRIKE
ncbi:MAG: hypothetical protein LBT05_13640 [Planctomycetaceae bacterium]|jgi:hypothetical protein|nr:hypothetical protein [Planctomycetaceae bacterium]